MKDTDWIFNICNGKERLRGEDGIKSHPTQKPLKLIQQILLSSSKKGDVVLDPFLGSGTTAVIAKAFGRNWIGIEKEEKYVKLASDRMKKYKIILKNYRKII